MKKVNYILLFVLCATLMYLCSSCMNASEEYIDNNTTEIKHEYLDGYEEDLTYLKMQEISSCTEPKQLSKILENIYKSEIIPTLIEYDENGNVIASAISLYNPNKNKGLLFKNIYIFQIPYKENPVFIMDDEGAYLVDNVEIKTFDDGTSAHYITSWDIEDLYLCLHGYAACEGDVKARNDLKCAVKNIESYIAFENLVRESIEKR